MYTIDFLIQKLISIPLILIALVGHEMAHGYVSVWLGDPTPKAYGRLSPNPLKHLDPIGALLMLITGFGWAKPVMVNPNYYKNPKWGTAAVSLAGPMSNLVMAFLSMLLYAVYLKLCIVFGWSSLAANEWIFMIAGLFAGYNLSLMLFNLIPIPPLDGSKVLGAFLPNSVYYGMLQYERYYSLILLGLIFLLSRLGVFSSIIGGGVTLISKAILSLLNLMF